MGGEKKRKRPGLTFLICSFILVSVIGYTSMEYGFGNENASKWILFVLLFSTLVNTIHFIKTKQKYYAIGCALVMLGTVFLIYPILFV